MFIFDFLPNWRNGVTETREYLTDIMVAHDQTEQRAAMRSKPRCMFTHSLLMHGAEASRFDWLMGAAQAQILLMPYWPHPCRLTDAVINGATEIWIDRALPSWVVPGAPLALLYGSKESIELRVLSIDGNKVTVDNDTLVKGNWPRGALVYPCWEGRVANNMSFKRHTPTVIEAGLTFTREVSGAAEPVRAYQPDQMYGDLEVMARDINWRDGMDASLTWALATLDNTRGRTSYDVMGLQQQRTSGGKVLLKNTQEAEWWFSFYHRMKGRRGVFMSPSRTRDLPLVKSPDTSKSHFAVEGTQFNTLGQPGVTMLTHIMIKFPDAPWTLHRILGLEPDYVRNVTYIKTFEPWVDHRGPELAPTHYLGSRCRLGSDSININWRTDGLGELGLSVTTVGANW